MKLREKKRRKEERKRNCQIFTFCWTGVNPRFFHDCFFPLFVSLLRSFLPTIYSLPSLFFSSFHFILSWGGLVYIFVYFSQYFALLSFLFLLPLPNSHSTLPILRRKTDKLGKLFLFNVFLSPLVFLTLPAFLLASSRCVLSASGFLLFLSSSSIYIYK